MIKVRVRTGPIVDGVQTLELVDVVEQQDLDAAVALINTTITNLPAPPTNTIFVDSTNICQSLFKSQDIHNQGPLVEFDSDIVMGGASNWNRVSNVFTYSGQPEYVKGEVQINAPQVVGNNSFWAKPKIRVLKGGVIIAVIDKLVMVESNAHDGDATINGSFTDAAPGVNPSYTFEFFDKDNRLATKLPIPGSSKLTMIATNKVEVLIP